MPWPDTRDGRGRGSWRPGLESRNYTATNGTATNGGVAILPDADRQYRARWRLAEERYRLGIARLAHEAMPLTVYYRRWWAA
jgi:hypothetical protein